jgi:hypothetical protein
MSFSTRFDPLIKAVARQAENVYTKMAIRRDETENFWRKKRGEDEAASRSIPWEDTTDVSILALRGFLEDLLGVPHTDQSILTTGELPLLPVTGNNEQHTPPATGASYAARAYRTTGRVVHDENVTSPPPVISTPSSALQLGDDFGDAERDMMRGYIDDLTALEKQGISHLTLRRSLTFLESIHQAIENTK